MPPIFELQRPYGFEDPSVLPLLDLVQGAQEAPAHDWGLHPFFERLLREQRSPGAAISGAEGGYPIAGSHQPAGNAGDHPRFGGGMGRWERVRWSRWQWAG
jgi:hypothetical protein